MIPLLVLLMNIHGIMSECVVNLDALTGSYPPLLVQQGRLLLPTTGKLLNFSVGAQLELYCHGSVVGQNTTTVNITGIAAVKSVLVKCTSSGNFYNGSTKVSVEAASCNKKQEPVILRSSSICSRVGADGRNTSTQALTQVQIGWQINNTFIEQIRLCVDESMYATIWTNHTLAGASLKYQDKDPARPAFRTDVTNMKTMFNWTTSTAMNDLYSKASQAKTVAATLGSNIIKSVPIIETATDGTHYFAKGHLSPDAAFVYNVQQDATYYFANVAPQFQSFNNGNWKALEMAARDLAIKAGHDVVEYSGTHEYLKYPDSNNNPAPIFLYTATGKQYVPAPLYYWKVLHDPSKNTAAAFIGLNNPHAVSPPKELCRNRCADMTWVDWNLTHLDGGYMYCCEVSDARLSIPSMPQIKASGLLLM